MNEMFCSCIIATVGRDTLSRAVESVLSQTLSGDSFEIIVVNDSGNPLPHNAWQDSEHVQIVDTNRRERSVARNTGAAMAHGRFLHFLDDDDWIAETAYHHLQELSQHTDAKWLYGMTQLLDRENQPTIVLTHGMSGNCFVQAMAGEWIPLQASLIERKLFWEVGGFNGLLMGPEDIDLQRRILLESDIAETSNLVAYVIRGEEGSTTDYLRHAQQSRQAREGILDLKYSFQRMRASATSPLWRGHMTRIYLTSVAWNLQHRRLMTAANRLIYAILSLLDAGKNLIYPGFWQSIFRSYDSLTFARGIREARSNKKDSL
jgi:glycosyltransferase involved in cell wall biosynthesis